jgi:hypothetical protein
MPRKDFNRMEAELCQLEKELTERLRTELNTVSSGVNTLFFFTAEYDPHEFPEHYLSRASGELLGIARETIKLRKQLSMPVERCVGRLFESACREHSDLGNPHRLGPIRLAERLMNEIADLAKARI